MGICAILLPHIHKLYAHVLKLEILTSCSDFFYLISNTLNTYLIFFCLTLKIKVGNYFFLIIFLLNYEIKMHKIVLAGINNSIVN